MCGFVAVLTRDPAFNERVLDDMRDRLAHRGPDGAGSWMERDQNGYAVGLGHRRLSIIDLRAIANQPMFSPDQRFVIAYNGEIYNYIEVRQELIQAGMTFRTDCDTEVLLRAYEKWGSDFFRKLNGMFACAIWDRRERVLLVFRDRFGEKPLYLAGLPGGGVAFASEIKGLLAHPHVSDEVDHERLQAFLRGGALIDCERTLFRNVSLFPAAHAAVYAETGRELRRWRYWTPDITVRKNTRPDEAAEELRELLKVSLKQRMRSDVKVGACLSGGIDSSTLVGISSRPENGGLRRTYSARFDDDPTISEGDFIDTVVNRAGVDSYPVSPTADGFVADARRLYWHQEIPFLSPSIYLEWCVLRRARQTGVKVMIDGQGADEVLGGYQHYFTYRQRDLLASGKLISLYRETMLANKRLDAVRDKYEHSARRLLGRVGVNIPQLIHDYTRDKGRRLFEKLRGSRAAMPNATQRSGLPERASIFKAFLVANLLYDMLPNQLHSADRSAMAFGVETRFPFLDYTLVDWCLKLPDHILVNNGWQKLILRRASKGYVPDAVRWRPDKVGFAAPTDRWMRGGMRQWMEARLFAPDLSDALGFNRAEIHKLWNEHVNGADRSWELFRFASAAEWLTLAQEGAWKRPFEASRGS